MTEPYELHRRAGEVLAVIVRQVREDALRRQTPCTEWDVRDLMHHITWSDLWVAPLVDGQNLADVAPTLEGDVLGDDPVGITLRAIDEASDAFERGGERPVELSRGMTPASIYCTERMNDLTVHAWDLARGIGVDVELDPECMEVSLEAYRPYEAVLRPAGELGPDIEVADDASLQVRYLAFFGRRADWTPLAA
jgi:uncharacterized protein (TIGR03086 family)